VVRINFGQAGHLTHRLLKKFQSSLFETRERRYYYSITTSI